MPGSKLNVRSSNRKTILRLAAGHFSLKESITLATTLLFKGLRCWLKELGLLMAWINRFPRQDAELTPGRFPLTLG
jgi:hypothetical protein